MGKYQMNASEPKLGRQINNVNGMAYAPTTELGVIYLFGRLAPNLGFCVESVHPHFPDCVATRRGVRCRIEFELWASQYENHGHPPRGADIIVCWENDWESRPKKYQHLKIIDLKKYVGATPRIFYTGCDMESHNHLELEKRNTEWNVPKDAQIGDLVLMYRSAPTSAIRDIWTIIGPFNDYAKDNGKWWPGRQAGIRRIAKLGQPLEYSELMSDLRTRDLTVVQMRFRNKGDITDDWPLLYDKIVHLNPNVKSALRKWRFD